MLRFRVFATLSLVLGDSALSGRMLSLISFLASPNTNKRERMLSLIFYTHFLTITTIFIISVASLPRSDAVHDYMYKACSSTLFSCGKNISNVGYPFWGDGRPQYCGHPSLELQCLSTEKGGMTMLKIRQDGVEPYNVQTMKFSHLHTSLELQLQSNVNCASYKKNFSEIFKLSSSVETITLLYNCSRDIAPSNLHDSYACPPDYEAHYLRNVSAGEEYASCKSVAVPVYRNLLDQYNREKGSLSNVLRQGFEARFEYSSECVKCNISGGICGSSQHSDFVCLCKDGSSENVCRNLGKQKLVLAIGIPGAVFFLLALCVALCMRSYPRPPREFAAVWKSEATTCPNVNAFLEIYGSFSLTRYTKANLKKMTNGFRDKLGEGGYAMVYRGKLCSGRLVAVKLLKQLKGDGKDFLNEVASISRTNHVNIVALLGFCFEGNKRALIYEFMPNGSLEKFTYHGASNQSLSWETLLNVATGIARGLDYLHRGCNARILHLDIKPHNILLDEEFCPKISDFGMARLCPLQESTVSMLEARGTIEYIAPEVFCRTVGGVSHKSDVYSFGMMVFDMVCGRKQLSTDMQGSSEMYFPEWIYNRLENQGEGAFQGIGNEQDRGLQRKMILVSLWCIQTYPSNRPSMSRVVEMLQGCLESIQMPPKPNLSSPPSFVLETSDTLAQTSDLESSLRTLAKTP